jgi:hypothetical protein
MEYLLPELQVNMIVVTSYNTLPNITPNKKYVIENIEQDIVWIRNDYNVVAPYKAINFAEADVYFSLCLYYTFMKLLNLTSKPLDSLDK